MRNVYDYVPSDGGQLSKAQAVLVGTELARLEKLNGSLTAEIVLETARAKDSPLHQFFLWTDVEAANEYRLTQARSLIRSVKIIVHQEKGQDVPVRAFLHIRSEDKYASTLKVLAQPDLRQQVLAQALRELQSWTVRYEHLSEVAAVVQAARKVLKP